MTRRETIAAFGAAALASAADFPDDLIQRHDEAIDRYLKIQVTDPAHRFRGGIPDAYGLHAPGTGIGLWEVFTAGFITSKSRHYRNRELIDRMKLAADFVDRSTSPEGNIYLPTTNFNSPPDSAFAARSAANTVLIARQAKVPEILAIVEPRLLRLANAITTGGIHTPNHRWVVCAALAQVNELMPDSKWMRRIDQWLAEGIDLDEEGQWTERSTGGYNAITDIAFVVMADKLKRPDLLEPARKNLETMLYMRHADGEVETSFSTRQDQNTRVTMGNYWFPVQYLAVKAGDRRFGQLARELFPKNASLSTLIAYPELNRTDIPGDPLPDDFVKEFPNNRLVRIRRKRASISINTAGRDRFLNIRYGDAVIEAIRFSTAFFGKAQFVPDSASRTQNGWTLTQNLEAPYYQPFTPTRKIGPDDWDKTQKQRPRTQICHLRQSATITEIQNGLRAEIVAEGTDNVPLTIEIKLRDNVRAEGVAGELFEAREARLIAGSDSIRITGGGCDHKYLDVRGARPRLGSPALFITGYTPFRRTLEFTWG